MKNAMKLTTRHFLTAVMLASTLAAPALSAHPQTERYIPIGQSSAKTVAGPIRSRESDPYRLTVAVDGTPVSIGLDEHTDIWIDRHEGGQTNPAGNYRDCPPGRYVEIKLRGTEPEVADWIKIRGR